MRSILLLAGIISSIIFSCNAPAESKVTSTDQTETTGYDSLLAQKFGADDYGMKQYVMAFLKAGPNRTQDSTEAANLQRAHLDNIKRMAQEGKLVLAGPFLDDQEIRGIYIFNVKTVEEAEELTKTDPAIQAGSLIMELHPWYGSAGLMQVNEIHPKLQKQSI